MISTRSLARPRILLTATAALLAALLGYGMYREKAEQPSQGLPPQDEPARGAAAHGAPPEAVATPGAPTTPSAADPTAQDLMKAVCSDGDMSCACRAEVIKKAFSLALQEAAREAVDQAPNDCIPELTSSGLRAEALARTGDLPAARREAEGLLLQQPKNPYATFATALVLFAGREPQLSRSVAQKAIEAGRGAPAHMLLGLVALREDKLPEAERHLDEALALDPADVEATFNRAVLFERRRDYNQAREHYLKVLALRPTHSDSRYSLARLTHAAGAFDEARHHLRKLVQIAPDDERIAALAAELRGEEPSSRVHRPPAPEQ